MNDWYAIMQGDSNNNNNNNDTNNNHQSTEKNIQNIKIFADTIEDKNILKNIDINNIKNTKYTHIEGYCEIDKQPKMDELEELQKEYIYEYREDGINQLCGKINTKQYWRLQIPQILYRNNYKEMQIWDTSNKKIPDWINILIKNSDNRTIKDSINILYRKPIIYTDDVKTYILIGNAAQYLGYEYHIDDTLAIESAIVLVHCQHNNLNIEKYNSIIQERIDTVYSAIQTEIEYQQQRNILEKYFEKMFQGYFRYFTSYGDEIEYNRIYGINLLSILSKASNSSE